MAVRGDATALSPQLRDYLRMNFPCEDELLKELRREAIAAGIPEIHISEEQASFMQVFLKSIGAKRALEIGTLAGYSAIVMARALPADGQLITLELDPSHADFAERYLQRAGLARRVQVVRGAALDTLPLLAGQTFDFAFLDADKSNYKRYLEHCLALVRPGGVIAVDNAFAFGQLFDETPADREAPAVKEFNQYFAWHSRLHSCIVPVGDGLALGYVLPG